MMRWLIGNLLGDSARQKIAETMAAVIGRQAVAARGADAGNAASAGLPPADVGVVFALANEADGFVARLQGVVARRGAGFTAFEGGLTGLRVVAVTSGPGSVAARRATEALLLGHRPEWVVSAGFAGGLDASVGRGEMFMPDSIVDVHGDRLTIGLEFQRPDAPTAPGWRTGRLLTVDRIVTAPEEKRRLGRAHGATAVDMETFAVADVCRQRKVRFLAVRVINDSVDDRLPDEVDQLMRQSTLAGRAGAVTAAIWRRPASVKDMWRLQRTALQASNRLAKFLEGVVVRLCAAGR